MGKAVSVACADARTRAASPQRARPNSSDGVRAAAVIACASDSLANSLAAPPALRPPRRDPVQFGNESEASWGWESFVSSGSLTERPWSSGDKLRFVLVLDLL